MGNFLSSGSLHGRDAKKYSSGSLLGGDVVSVGDDTSEDDDGTESPSFGGDWE